MSKFYDENRDNEVNRWANLETSQHDANDILEDRNNIHEGA